MKKLLIIITAALFSISAFAIEFEKGANVKDIHPRMLRKLLIQGKTKAPDGSKIKIAPGTQIPSNYRKKWDEIKLSGGDVPSEGSAAADVILIKGF
ncbi:MAG: hypothetical protein QF441_02730 [Bacteriovoracaceae bacterium]|jgi:hypothetical protein|nr:hypothetical protein [Halobacteriovoraceae bacterium]MDP7319490.1 hypothetical protein [Bacteriovoracaceae bacterium]|tara:strand:+ start:400 stop:687 length:288 start_codon:yes stop_codon:yes gene_type:complete